VDGPGCEPYLDAFLREPVAALSSLAYVAAALLGRPAPPMYALLVAGIGVGSFVQHGPNPPLADLAHDLPLAGTLLYVAADSIARLTGRPHRTWWWVVPLGGLVPLILAAPGLADGEQVGMAGVAVLASGARAGAHTDERTRIALALGLLAAGGAIGRLSVSGGPLCEPDSLLQGHAVWHLMSAAALAVLAPIMRRA